MAIVSNNKNGKGNPLHSEKTGQFISKDDGGKASEEIVSEKQIETNNLKNQNDTSLDELEKETFDTNDDELESLLNELDKLDDDDELDNLLNELDDDDEFDEWFEDSFGDLEITGSTKEFTEEEAKETLENLSIYFDLDKNKIKDLSLEEMLQILEAIKTINVTDKVLDQELESYNQEQFYNLWISPVKPNDYIDKKNKIEAKKQYFLNDYTGNDKEQKLQDLENFVKAGEKYLEVAEKKDSKYLKAKNILAYYEDENSVYSQTRKDNAYWFKNFSESKNFFGETTEKAIKKMGGTNSFEYQMAKYYTMSFSCFNEPLRKKYYSGTNMTGHGFIKQVEGLTKAIDCSESEHDIWLQRGTSSIYIDESLTLGWNTDEKTLKSLVGKSFVDQGFVSAGSHKGGGFSDKNYIMNIYCPKGTKMLYVEPFSYFSGEDEHIIQRGYTYKITKAQKDKYGTVYLDVDIVLSSDNQKYSTKQLSELEKKYT